MSYHAYDLDSSESSDSILQKPQKKSKKITQGYSNNQARRNNTQTNEYSDEYENIQPQGNLKKSNKPKKSSLNEKTKRKNYDIQDSDEDNDDDNDDSYNSQRNSAKNQPNQSKLRAYSYGKSHKNDTKFLNFDLSDNEYDHDHEHSMKNKNKKSPDSSSRSNTKYSYTIGGGENSLNYKSKDFNPQVKSKTKNIIRTNDFSNKKSPKKTYSKVQYHNYDSDDNSYDDHEYSDDKQKIGNKTQKTKSRMVYDQTDSDNDSRKNSERKKIDKEQVKESSSYSFNENCDWSFPMNYVPDPDDMKQIIEDYHDKYSIDYLLKRIMNNPSYRSSNDE